ncbi:hypothetical protein KY366_04480 [Candidatus Woesearchaeota archaeon]|nr:hypothetical protein [Candidatus Woesearchaeota archaeon]
MTNRLRHFLRKYSEIITIISIIVTIISIIVALNYRSKLIQIQGDYNDLSTDYNVLNSSFTQISNKYENCIVNSPDSINIIGDDNKVNKVDIPPPQFEWTDISLNQPKDKYNSQNLYSTFENVFKSEKDLSINSKTLLKEITIFSPDENVFDIDVSKEGHTTYMIGLGEYNKKDVVYIKIQTPTGPYKIIIYSKKPISPEFQLLIDYIK